MINHILCDIQLTIYHPLISHLNNLRVQTVPQNQINVPVVQTVRATSVAVAHLSQRRRSVAVVAIQNPTKEATDVFLTIHRDLDILVKAVSVSI